MYIVHILYILWTFVYPSSTTWHPAVPRLTMGRSSQRLRPLLSTCQRFVRCGVAVACSPEMLPASPKASDVCNYFQSIYYWCLQLYVHMYNIYIYILNHLMFAITPSPIKRPEKIISSFFQAFHDARVVRFDATKLLPKHMFNATLQDIERLCFGEDRRSGRRGYPLVNIQKAMERSTIFNR